MAKRQRHTPEQVISKPREAEVELAKGVAPALVCKDLAVTEQTYWPLPRLTCWTPPTINIAPGSFIRRTLASVLSESM